MMNPVIKTDKLFFRNALQSCLILPVCYSCLLQPFSLFQLRVYIYVFLILYSFSTEGHKFISMYILLCVLPSLNKGFTYLLTYLLTYRIFRVLSSLNPFNTKRAKDQNLIKFTNFALASKE